MNEATSPSNRILRLGVNVDHVATLRQARGTLYPSPVDAAREAMAAGADSITIHLREDRRHIQDSDVETLCGSPDVPINLEMALTDEMLAIAARVKPRDVCLVPERREELTTEGGLDVASQVSRVREGMQQLIAAGASPALFIDPDEAQVRASAEAGAASVELHTGTYADAVNDTDREDELARVVAAARLADELGLGVHAGHGLNVDNVGPVAAIDTVVELNIGHALIARAIFTGLPAAVHEMRAAMDAARGES